MAILNNISKDISLSLSLFKKDNHLKWMCYTLTVHVKETTSSRIFLILDDENHSLFLDNYIEPEIPKLIVNIENILNSHIKEYFFEPIDDGDFSLEIKTSNNSYAITLFVEEVNILNVYQWHSKAKIGLTFKVSQEDLTAFLDELKAEFIALTRA